MVIVATVLLLTHLWQNKTLITACAGKRLQPQRSWPLDKWQRDKTRALDTLPTGELQSLDNSCDVWTLYLCLR